MDYAYRIYGWTRGLIQYYSSDYFPPHWSDANKVYENIYVGNIYAAYDKNFLEENNITHIINCVNGSSGGFPKDYEYLNLPLVDENYENIFPFFKSSCEFIKKALDENGTIYIHCVCGVSRSATIAAAYIILQEPDTSVDEIIQRMQEQRNKINPRKQFRNQLEKWSKYQFGVIQEIILSTIESLP